MVPFASEVGFTVMAGQAGATVKGREPRQVFASVAAMVKVWLVVLVGVPLSTPAVESERPAGSVPLVTA